MDSAGNAFVTGKTLSSNFPTANPLQPSLEGSSDAFVARLSEDGTTLVYATYLGGNVEDNGNDLAVDAAGNAFVTGNTSSTNFPTATPFQSTYGGSIDTFVTKTLPVPPAGPYITAQSPTRRHAPVSSLRLAFDRPIDPDTFSPEDVPYFEGPLGFLAVTAVTAVPGSGGRQFDLHFPEQAVTGVYTLHVGPFINDLAGNPMDQTPDGILGHSDDYYLASFGIEGSRVLSSSPDGVVAGPVERVRLTFNTAINPATFEPLDIYFWTGPDGAVAVARIEAVEGSDGRQFDVIPHTPLTAPGRYVLGLWPDVRDRWGNPLDQDNDLIGGEGFEDGYLAFFEIAVR